MADVMRRLNDLERRVAAVETVSIRLLPNDDRFNAYVDSKSNPYANSAAAAGVKASMISVAVPHPTAGNPSIWPKDISRSWSTLWMPALRSAFLALLERFRAPIPSSSERS